jgi:hypothetical protein
LKYGYFHEIDSKIKLVENRKKEEFLNVINKEFRDVLVNFKFNYNPFNMIISAKTKMMKIGGNYYDLGTIALNYPEEKRTHDMLITISEDYRDVRRHMESELIDLGLHPSARPCAIGKVEKFLKENNIFGFVPEIY